MSKLFSRNAGTPSLFLYNGMCNSLSSLALRFATMAFNIYLSSKAGAGAMGLLSLTYSVWGLALTLGCASGGLVSSRACAEAILLKQDVRGTASKCLRYSFLCGTITSAVLFSLSSIIGGTLIADTRTVAPLKIMSISLPFISMSTSLNGYFNAKTRSYKNAIVQVCEQIIRMSVTVLIFTLSHKTDAKSACISIVLGGALAEVISFFLLFILFLYDVREHPHTDGEHCSYKKLSAISLPVTFSAAVRTALVSIEHILIPKCLVTYGTAYETSLALFGTVHGMAIPTVLFCYALPSAFSGLLIPKISEYHVSKNQKELLYVANRAYRFTLCFSLGVSAFLMFSADIVGSTLYPGMGAGHYIYLLAPLIPVMYVDSVSDSLLKGLDLQQHSMMINIADAAISVICVALAVPEIGIYGYIVAIYLSEIFNTCASIFKILKVTGYRFHTVKHICVPTIVAIASSKLTSPLYSLTVGIGMPFALFIGILSFTLTYIFLLYATKNLSYEEQLWVKKALLFKK